MYSLRPHKNFNFVGIWKYCFIISGILIALAIAGFVASTVITGTPLTLGTEFSGGTSVQINNAPNVTEDDLKSAFSNAASELGYDTQISSVQTSTTMSGGEGYIVKTTDTVSTNASEIMKHVEESLGINAADVEIETIGASWGASVIWSSIIAFILSCIGILLVITFRYRDPRMGAVALITLFHDMIIVLGIYAWAGLFFHMEITSDVIAALLAIVGYSLYDTVVVFHRINRNASPQMKMSLRTCANKSQNEVIVRSVNTSITSVLPIVFMLILGTDTLLDFAFAMFCGMIIGFYSTQALSAPLYTIWKAKDPDYARLEKKYPYEVIQSPFTKPMLLEARKESKARRKLEKAEAREAAAKEREAERARKLEEARQAKEAEKIRKAEEQAKAAELKELEAEENVAVAQFDLEQEKEQFDELAQESNPHYNCAKVEDPASESAEGEQVDGATDDDDVVMTVSVSIPDLDGDFDSDDEPIEILEEEAIEFSDEEAPDPDSQESVIEKGVEIPDAVEAEGADMPDSEMPKPDEE